MVDSSKNEILLSGEEISIEDVEKVARDEVEVAITSKAEERIRKTREFVFKKLSDNNEEAVYGLNRGVGANKDQRIFSDYYEEYNRKLIYAHCVAVEPEASIEEVRAVMLARLNTLLVGRTGIQPEIVRRYRDFLNYGIHPVMPKRGSVGEGDISCLSHIGLAMIGEGEVFYQGERMEASKVFEKTGLEPITLGPKDGLAIVSSNALSAGQAALLLNDIKRLIKVADLVYALSLEGLKGNTTPLEEKVQKARGYEGQKESAQRIRDCLKDSYLWESNVAGSFQDSLTYRSTCGVHGSVLDALGYAKDQLEVQLNSSDDNPCVLPEDDKMISSGNYEPLSWVLSLEMLNIALGHVSKSSCNRTKQLANPDVTGLSKFLTPAEGQVIAYGTIQKSYASLDSENQNLANPSSLNYHSLALEIEDRGTNATQVVEKLQKIIDNIYYILGIEAMHAVQAIDLRGITEAMAEPTRKAYGVIREEVPFLEEDRVLTKDIKKAYQVLKSERILEKVNSLK